MAEDRGGLNRRMVYVVYRMIISSPTRVDEEMIDEAILRVEMVVNRGGEPMLHTEAGAPVGVRLVYFDRMEFDTDATGS